MVRKKDDVPNKYKAAQDSSSDPQPVRGLIFHYVARISQFHRSIFVDFLCKVMLDGKPCLIHIEFQRNIRAGIPMRLLEYNVLASREYKELPVYSFVIYLVDDGTIEESPLIRKLPNGKEVLQFYYESIRLWDMDPKLFWQLGREGILPLVILTTGRCIDIVDDIEVLQSAVIKVSSMQTIEELFHLLLEIDKA